MMSSDHRTADLSAGADPHHPLDEQSTRQRHWFAVALSSIGDGVITADLHGRVTFMNPVAESLTGWTTGEAEGQPLEQVFRIVNEDTRAEVQNPALRAMQEGVIVGLENHTLLLTKDGREIGIDDSGAPIRTETGECLGAILVFRDVTERRQADEARALLAAIVESSTDAIISKNLDGIVTSWNGAAQQMFGYTPAEAIGRHITFLIPEERRDEETMILSRVRRGERIEHFETERVSKDGRHVAISLSVSPVRGRHGEVVGASKIARDISERLRADAERARLVMSERSARERAESASRAKDEFVAMISHEMRSPLNAILGWAQMLRQAPLDTLTAARALDSIDRNARAQVQLLDDLLDISRAITGKLRVAMRPVDLRQSLQAALESIRPATEAKSITIHMHDERHGSVVTGDADRLQQIFWNLLSNAVKFTPKHGQITVTMRQTNSQVETTVSDSGIGIAADFLPHVFERFAQAETRTGKHGGLGLGLAIARQLVELHGGIISAASGGEGQGATFIVKLPVRAIREDAEGREPTHSVEASVPPPDLEGVRVMVVDDEPETRKLLSAVLNTRGATVKSCASAVEALAVIDEWKPTVLVSDIGMPEEDGYSLVRRVRRLASEQRSVPAVALTAYARDEDRIQALAAGFQMHVPKPIEFTELLLVVATLSHQAPLPE